MSISLIIEAGPMSGLESLVLLHIVMHHKIIFKKSEAM